MVLMRINHSNRCYAQITSSAALTRHTTNKFSSDRNRASDRDNETVVFSDGKTTKIVDRHVVATRHLAWTILETDDVPLEVNRIIESKLTEVPIVNFDSHFVETDDVLFEVNRIIASAKLTEVPIVNFDPHFLERVVTIAPRSEASHQQHISKKQTIP